MKKVDQLFKELKESGRQPKFLILNPYSYAEMLSEVADNKEDMMLEDLHHYRGMIVAVTTAPDSEEVSIAL